MHIRIGHYSVLIGLVTAFLLVVLSQYASVEMTPAEKGFLDLSRLTPRELSHPRYLQGEWEFYPEIFLEPRQDPPADWPSYRLSVPGDWNTQLRDVEGFARGLGYGTYRLTLELPPGDHALGLVVHDPATALRLYAGETLLLSIGEPGKSKETSRPRYEYRTAFFHGRDSVTFTCHFSNFHHRRGGFWDALLLGGQEQIVRISLFDFGIGFMIIGSILVMAFHHLILYLMGCSRKEYLFFFWLALCMTLRIMTTNTFLISFVFPSVPWGLQVKLEYLSYTAGLIFAMLLYKELFPSLLPRSIRTAVLNFFFLYGLMILLLPQRIYSLALEPSLVAAGFLGMFVLVRLCSLAARKVEHAVPLLIVSILYFLAYLNDTLYLRFVQKNTRMGNLSPFSLLILITALDFILAERYRQAIKTSEVLTKRLDDKVKERTELLEVEKEQLHQDAIHDKLTGLLNRNELEERASFFNREDQEGRTVTLLYLDLDHFKEINDSAGHSVGDFVLRETARSMKREFRRTDMLFRAGGDEFIVILPDTTAEGASGTVERFLRIIEEKDSFRREISLMFKQELIISHPLSCSAGIAERHRGESFEALIDRADQALLTAKTEGKNRFRISPPDISLASGMI